MSFLKYDRSQNLSQYCTNFDLAWTRLTAVCNNASASYSNDMPYLLRDFFRSNNCKTQLLLRSLPMEMDNIRDNLLTKSHLDYNSVVQSLSNTSTSAPDDIVPPSAMQVSSKSTS